MFWKIFGRGEKYVDVKSDGTVVEKKNKWIVFLIIAAVCFLAFGNLGGKEKKDDEKKINVKDEIVVSEYIEQTEKRLEEIISEIKGVGNVSVMVSFDSMSEKILAKDNKNEVSEDVDKEKNTSSFRNEEKIFLFGAGTEEKPFIVKERLPVPSGVLVVASGAGNESVRLEVYEAVKALFGISGHRIKVATSKGKI